MAIPIRRRELVLVLGGIAAAWPLAARAQQPTTPVIGFISGRSPDESEAVVAFRQGLAKPAMSKVRMCISRSAGRKVDTIDFPKWQPNWLTFR